MPLAVLIAVAGGACAFVLAGLLLVWSARRVGRSGPRCGNCGYNLTGAPSNRCGECGRLFIEAGVITRTIAARRRFRMGLLALAAQAVRQAELQAVLERSALLFQRERGYPTPNFRLIPNYPAPTRVSP